MASSKSTSVEGIYLQALGDTPHPGIFSSHFLGIGPGWNLLLELDNPSAYADRDRFRAITRPQLLHDVLDVNLDSFFRDKQLLRDVSIPVSAGDLTEDLDLAFGQGFVAHMLRKLRRQLRGDTLFSCIDLADDLDNSLGGMLLSM